MIAGSTQLTTRLLPLHRLGTKVADHSPKWNGAIGHAISSFGAGDFR